MSERLTQEIACWRVWNYLRVHDCGFEKLYTSVGVPKNTFGEVIELMVDQNIVTVEKGAGLDGDKYTLTTRGEDSPPFTAIFPTISEVNNER